jgi:hypothetical protein
MRFFRRKADTYTDQEMLWDHMESIDLFYEDYDDSSDEAVPGYFYPFNVINLETGYHPSYDDNVRP